MTLLRPRVIERTPCLMRWRVSARPSYVPSRCLHGSTRLGQTQPTTRPETPTAIIPPPPGPLSRRTSKSKTAPAVHIHRPQVLPPSIDNSAPKIHILGEDEKSKYLAHVLSGLQNSIELLSWRSTPRAKNAKNRYTNVQKRIESGEAKPAIETNRAGESPAPTQAKDEPISQLVVTGSGAEAVPALEAVKHRLNNSTTVLLMSDGLGVLEDVRRRVFQNSDASPNFLLGHMSHRLGYNRNHNSVKVLRPGSIKITDKTDIRFGKPRKWVPKMGMHQRFHRTDQLVESFQAADVNAGLTEYDSWLRFKLPSIMFDSVVEPVCVLLDLPYAGLMQNPAARHLLRDLTTEISNLLRHLPEIDRSPVIQAYLDEARLSKELFRAILGKRDQPSKLALQINKGLPTDVNYLHGYYIRRANALGIDVRTSVLVRTIIKAKHSIAIEKRNSWVAFDEMSIPPGEDPFKYRTVPGLHSNRHYRFLWELGCLGWPVSVAANLYSTRHDRFISGV